MIERKKLVDVFPNWAAGGGIFAAVNAYNVPWRGESVSRSLDIEYYGNISGDKYISPLIDKIIVGDVLTEAEMIIIASTIFALNGVNWEREWATRGLDYNPIENYSMTEQMIDDKTVNEYGKTNTRTDDLTHTKTGADTDTPNITETQTPDLQTSADESLYGFNSPNAVPTGERNQKATGTNTNVRTGTETHNYDTTDKDTGTQTESVSGQDTQTHNYKLTRSGNIGVTTSQQMIESERTLWLWNYFREIVFPDVDKILTLRIY